MKKLILAASLVLAALSMTACPGGDTSDAGMADAG